MIYHALKSDKPFLVARMGSTEQRAIMNSLALQYGLRNTIDPYNISSLVKNSGFFFSEHEKSQENVLRAVTRFAEMSLDALRVCDIYAIWDNYGDEYLIRNYLRKDGRICRLEALEPWYMPNEPWSRALEGKNVLFISPLAETIRKQAKSSNKLFPGTDILPPFNLKCLKAVQTIAGNRDSRFRDWFEALDWMYHEIRKIDYDVAIVGCGAYGLPLSGMLKRDNKQVILMGGATQLFMGIKGKRWSERPFFQKLFNEYWVYPREEDRPKNYSTIENGCYW